MMDLKPELLKEWHPSRNVEMKACEASYNHREKVWWICAQGHEWEATIRTRLRGKSCPFCRNMVPQIPSTSSQPMSAAFRTSGDQPPVLATTPLEAFLDSHTAPCGGMEMRKSRRYERSETVMVENPHSEIFGYAQLKNFSSNGMMLFSDFAVRPGELLKIRFEKPLHSSVPKTVATSAVWCRDLEDKVETAFRFAIGFCLL
jgi:hypothetical protein